MTAENHSPPARSLRRTQCTILRVVYNCALSKLRGFRLLPFQQFFQYILRVLPVKNVSSISHPYVNQAFICEKLSKRFLRSASGVRPFLSNGIYSTDAVMPPASLMAFRSSFSLSPNSGVGHPALRYQARPENTHFPVSAHKSCSRFSHFSTA